ncbi:MAG TPA: DNA-directed RNA polymerase subunit alpha [Firmicutes bacterium]|nr:DNA-directed RNA polymerase subunit alpha [Bacillota bacterium]
MKDFVPVEFAPAEAKDNYIRISLKPLERGYGITLGNALRRVLLSSIQGPSPVRLTIKGARHEYAVVPGIVDDITAIELNVKALVVRLNSADHDSVRTLKVEKVNDTDTEMEVKAADLVCPPDIQIVNPDLVLARLAPKGCIKMDIDVAEGRGYASNDENKERFGALTVTDGDTFPIMLDSSFSPIVKVNFSVAPTAVENRTDYEQLVLEVWTTGAIDPKSAISEAAAILTHYLNYFTQMDEHVAQGMKDQLNSTVPAKKDDGADQPIETLDLNVRAFNCLKRAGIVTVGDLINKSEDELMKIRNLGKKSIKEVKDKLKQKNYRFRNEKD